MNIISVGSDRDIFIEGSPVRERVIKYGGLCNNLHIIIFTKRNLGFTQTQISKNVFIYPTSSLSKWLYIYDAYKIGKTILDIDMVTTQDPFESGLAGMFIARTQKAKLHIQIHTDFLSPFFKTSYLNRIRIYIAKMIIPRADCIRVVSNRIKDSIQRHFHLVVTPIILPIFIDIEKCKSAAVSTDVHKKYPQFDFILLMVSRFEKEKNIKAGIDALKILSKESKNVGLVIVGDGSERKSLESYVKKIRLMDYVVFEGWKTDVISYYKSSDLFLNTSLYEGYGQTLVEALATGTPVLTTDVGVADEIGADIFVSEEDLTSKISSYILGKGKKQVLQNYPYHNEDMYLLQLKDSWNKCV